MPLKSPAQRCLRRIAGIAAVGTVTALAGTALSQAPPDVRPVPPPGITLAPADRESLQHETDALARDVATLRARPELAERLPDVEIYLRAVTSALEHDELFVADDVGRAHRLLAIGRERAAALAAGQTPWLTKAGPTALGYVSELDGSVQPYGLFLPSSWTAADARPWRLDTWFHGRGERLSEVSFIASVSDSGGPFTRPDALVLQPYGRYCNGSKLAGEVDFNEALADVKRRFRIDPDRILIRGFSLGGHSAWQVGAHFASDWAAVAPGAGFAESTEFLRMSEKDPLEPTWWEEKLFALYDAPAYAENFRNVPLVAYSGEIDAQKQAASLMSKVLAGVGLDMVHVIGPKTAHEYHPQAKVEIDRLLDALALRGRDPLPRRVSLATPTLKYNRQAWVEVDALGRHWEKATVEAELVGDDAVRLRTRNVTALTLTMPPGRAPFFPGRPITVTLDLQALPGPRPASDRSWVAHFHRVADRWVAGPLPEAGVLRKRHDLQGPIDDAFMGSFLMVSPSGEGLAPKTVAWAASEEARALREWRRQFRGEARVKKDDAVTEDDIARHNLVLWGDPESNSVLARIADKLPVRWTRAGITVGGRTYPADTHAVILVYPNPLDPRHYVVLNSGFTFREYDYLNNARQTPKLPDWAVVDVTVPPDARRPGRIADADFFDESWRVRPRR